MGLLKYDFAAYRSASSLSYLAQNLKNTNLGAQNHANTIVLFLGIHLWYDKCLGLAFSQVEI